MDVQAASLIGAGLAAIGAGMAAIGVGNVFGSFVVQGFNAGGGLGSLVGVLSFVMIIGVSALELLVCAIQAYVFALLTSLYLHDAVHLH